MNQHDRVEQSLAEHAEQARERLNLAHALVQIETAIGLLAHHVNFESYSGREEMTAALDRVRRAVRAVEQDV